MVLIIKVGLGGLINLFDISIIKNDKLFFLTD